MWLGYGAAPHRLAGVRPYLGQEGPHLEHANTLPRRRRRRRQRLASLQVSLSLSDLLTQRGENLPSEPAPALRAGARLHQGMLDSACCCCCHSHSGHTAPMATTTTATTSYTRGSATSSATKASISITASTTDPLWPPL